MPVANETCENCGRAIGKLETPHIHDGHVVCAICKKALEPAPLDYRSAPVARAAAQPLPGSTSSTDLRDKYQIPACPGCGARIAAKKKAKGSTLLLVVLLLLWVLPGLLYLIFCNGYIYVCPVCGMKRGDAA